MNLFEQRVSSVLTTTDQRIYSHRVLPSIIIIIIVIIKRCRYRHAFCTNIQDGGQKPEVVKFQLQQRNMARVTLQGRRTMFAAHTLRNS